MTYMCVTAHYIDSNWEIQKKVIAFKAVDDHKGVTIVKVLFEVIREWGIRRIACITVDNAYNNSVAIKEITKKLWKDDMLLEGKHLHFRCACHIINLIVQEGLQVSNDSIMKIRAAMKCIRSSEARETAFKTYLEAEGLPFEKKMWLDSITRWNSTYIMLDKAYPARNAIMRMDFSNDWELNDSDWEMAALYLNYFGLFHDATTTLSATKSATVHQYASVMFQLQLVITSSATSDETQSPELYKAASEMLDKVNQYWGNRENMNILVIVASLLDPGNKSSMTMEIFASLYPSSFSSELESLEWDHCRYIAEAQTCLQELYDLYAKVWENVSSSSSTSVALSDVSSTTQGETRPSSGLKNLVKDCYKNRNPKFIKPQATELEQYLERDGLVEDHEGFGVILWWKVNGYKYPTLQRIAKDLLAIHVSTVASESTFSTGGRTITDFRCRLLPETVESLICVQSWLSGGSFTLVNAVEIIEVFDDDNDEGANSTMGKDDGA